uniref:F-box domain-containing protein n=1 Tax=Kalanchoe fedtschenkoi TaxID=63787 RepID=A0A7N0TQ79_KALFE
MLQGDTLTPSLPDDIIFDILSRLPVRSATRFESVCKCWHSLIRSRIFIEMHLRSGLQTIDRLQLWFSVHPCGFLFRYRNIVRSLNFVTQKNVVWLAPSSSPNLYSLFLPPPYSCRSVYNFFMGSCNGLLCFNLQGRSMLNLQPFMWNPATGAFRFMSEDDVSAVDVCDKTPLKLKGSCFIFCYGFGYDSSIDDYKIVRLVQYSNRESLLLVDLLAVGGNKLRRFQFPLRADIRSQSGCSFMGRCIGLCVDNFLNISSYV